MQQVDAENPAICSRCGDLTGPFCTGRFERNCLGKELVMPKKKMFNAERIVTLLRQINARWDAAPKIERARGS
jgi:hypothetical protein